MVNAILMTIVFGLVSILIFFRFKNQQNMFKSHGTITKNSSLNDLLSALKNDVYHQIDKANYKCFVKTLETDQIEIEINTTGKNINIDLDVKPKHFKIGLPENISPTFFDRVFLSALNAKLLKLSDLELLTDVNDGQYFCRQSLKCAKKNCPDLDHLNNLIKKGRQYFSEFNFLDQFALQHPFFQYIESNDYQAEYCENQVLVRFSKKTASHHLSVYFAPEIDLLMLVSTQLVEGNVVEDFLEAESSGHQFYDKTSELPQIIYPEVEEFESLERELTKIPKSDEEE